MEKVIKRVREREKRRKRKAALHKMLEFIFPAARAYMPNEAIAAANAQSA
jgi:hypothetical protein